MCERVRSRIVALVLVVLASSSPALTQVLSFAPASKIKTVDGQEGDHFGEDVALQGSTLAIGSHRDDDAGEDAGAVYIYRAVGGPGPWRLAAKLTAEDADAGDWLGLTLALDGARMVVAAKHDEEAGENSGSAYVFELEGNLWVQAAKLTPADGAAGDEFGRSVALAGDTVVVGAFADDDDGVDSGSAYVFERNPEGGWPQIAKLVASDAGGGEFFGSWVALSGDTAVVTAVDGSGGAGSAYVFERDAGGVNEWGEVAKLEADDGVAGDLFGIAVAIESDTILVGASARDEVAVDSGATYVFERDAGGTDAWGRTAKVTPRDASEGDFFGGAVTLDGDRAVVGARFSDDGRGAAYVFDRDLGGVGAWGQVARLTAPDGAPDDLLGAAIATGDGTIVVGAFRDDDLGLDAGSAYLFDGLLVAPTVSVVGSCPGTVTVAASGATPRAPIQLWSGATEGIFTLSSGPCTGLELDLESPTLLVSTRADRDGTFGVRREISGALCGRLLQVVDETSCAAGAPAPLP